MSASRSRPERQSERRWSLTLYGEFSLCDLLGRPIALNNRKLEGLLAVLVVCREHGISRTAAAQILWPDRSEESRRLNLRQTLHLLKDVLGEQAIVPDRTNLRLRPCFPLESDHPLKAEPGRTRSSSFMPGHEGDWFDEIRFESSSGTEEDVVEHLVQTARWLAKADPKGMVALFGVNRFLTRGIPFSVMLGLLQDAEISQDQTGWADYWRGTAEDDLEICALNLRSALQKARVARDFVLGSEVCLELGKVYARTGAFDEATRIGRLASSIAQSSGVRVAKYCARRVNGLTHMHAARHEAGLKLLAESEEFIDSEFERSSAQSVRAFFEASAGLFDRSARTLHDVRDSSRTLGRQSPGLVESLTRSVLTAPENRPSAAKSLSQISTQCHEGRCTQLAVYADELLAKIYLLEGEKSLASERISQASRGRVRARMAVTPIERRRLKAIEG